jgi:hypothetical protein
MGLFSRKLKLDADGIPILSGDAQALLALVYQQEAGLRLSLRDERIFASRKLRDAGLVHVEQASPWDADTALITPSVWARRIRLWIAEDDEPDVFPDGRPAPRQAREDEVGLAEYLQERDRYRVAMREAGREPMDFGFSPFG